MLTNNLSLKRSCVSLLTLIALLGTTDVVFGMNPEDEDPRYRTIPYKPDDSDAEMQAAIALSLGQTLPQKRTQTPEEDALAEIALLDRLLPKNLRGEDKYIDFDTGCNMVPLATTIKDMEVILNTSGHPRDDFYKTTFSNLQKNRFVQRVLGGWVPEKANSHFAAQSMLHSRIDALNTRLQTLGYGSLSTQNLAMVPATSTHRNLTMVPESSIVKKMTVQEGLKFLQGTMDNYEPHQISKLSTILNVIEGNLEVFKSLKDEIEKAKIRGLLISSIKDLNGSQFAQAVRQGLKPNNCVFNDPRLHLCERIKILDAHLKTVSLEESGADEEHKTLQGKMDNITPVQCSNLNNLFDRIEAYLGTFNGMTIAQTQEDLRACFKLMDEQSGFVKAFRKGLRPQNLVKNDPRVPLFERIQRIDSLRSQLQIEEALPENAVSFQRNISEDRIAYLRGVFANVEQNLEKLTSYMGEDVGKDAIRVATQLLLRSVENDSFVIACRKGEISNDIGGLAEMIRNIDFQLGFVSLAMKSQVYQTEAGPVVSQNPDRSNVMEIDEEEALRLAIEASLQDFDKDAN